MKEKENIIGQINGKSRLISNLISEEGAGYTIATSYHDLVCLVEKVKEFDPNLHNELRKKLLFLNKGVFGEAFILPHAVAQDKKQKQISGNNLLLSIKSSNEISAKKRKFLKNYFMQFIPTKPVSVECGPRPNPKQVYFGTDLSTNLQTPIA